MINYDKFLGSVLGSAIGDALGAPIEGIKPSRINPLLNNITIPYTYQSIQNIRKTVIGNYRDLIGLHTDETQYLLVLLDSITTETKNMFKFNLNKSLNLFRELYNQKISGSNAGAIRGSGKNARITFQKLMENKPFNSLGTDSAGMGS